MHFKVQMGFVIIENPLRLLIHVKYQNNMCILTMGKAKAKCFLLHILYMRY